MRAARNQYEELKRYNRLPKIKRRAEVDLKRAIGRGDLVRAQRHARRIYMAENRLVNDAPMIVSKFSDFN